MIIRLLLIACFLIVSCDLPNEADSDCNGVSLGTAYIDDCGRCVEGNTLFSEGVDKDECGECFGVGDLKCNDSDAINYFDVEEHCVDNDLCLFDICSEYMPIVSENYKCDPLTDNSIYNVGDQLRCNDVEENFDLCFPDNCENEFDLSMLYGKVIWIELTASW